MVALTLSPFIVAPAAIWLVSRRPESARWLAAWPAALTLVFAFQLHSTVERGARLVHASWAPSLGLSLTFLLDGLGLLFALLITGIGTLIVAYASAYLRDHEHAGRFYGALFAFMGAMLGVALSDNLLTLFVFWELTGFTSFLLIAFEHERPDARAAALQALIVTGAGGLALLAGALLAGQASGTFSLSELLGRDIAWSREPHYAVIATLFLAAAFTKSAQAPFHFWLPNAMAAPTPVSAYLHSATMVKAGVYLIARMAPLLGGTQYWIALVTGIGAITMIVGAWRAVQQTHLKRLLAYSTVSALGVMTLLFGLGTEAAAVAGLVYLTAHACYKGALFLVAGAVEHETGTRDVTVLGGLRRAMPSTFAASVAAAASMAGVPLLLGFVAKESLYDAALHGGSWMLAPLVLSVAASVLLGVVALVAGVVPFMGAARGNDAVHEAPAALWGPPLVLATAGVLGGLVPALLDAPLGAAAASVLGRPADIHLAVWHGFTLTLASSLLTLALIPIAYKGVALYRRVSTGRIGTEGLYTGALDALDAISRAISPALHSASLRSYVLAVAVTSVAFIGGALALGGDVRSFNIATNVRAHEVLIVGVIVAGGFSAARATSSMVAVLSLGVVGYGIALLFVSFGAPDLAMTQFSVETLTAVILVLVFRHFPRLGALSPGLVRLRDLAVSGAIGAMIASLVLLVGTSGTPSRLAGYFVDHSVALAHGRNVVNVILVDFRAFDTFGEITVLVTAAIGVIAALRIGGRLSPSTDEGDGRAELPVSTILRAGTRTLMPLLLLFALFLLFRGHNEPGGGFVAGLVVSAAFALYVVSYGVKAARRALIVSPRMLLGGGLGVALVSGLPALVAGRPFLTASWSAGGIPLGTPLVFDIGVFLVVIGVVLAMTFNLSEEA